MKPGAFDPLELLATLVRHHVRFVMIGGLAGRIWGSPTVTNDLDICYARPRANLERLADALRDLDARLRGVPEDVPFLLDVETLAAGDHFTCVTRAGNLDCLGFPAGSGGYEKLRATATGMELGEVEVLVADLRDLIRMKQASGRPKDLIEVEILKEVLDERQRSQS
jgi:hypothetical protein